MTSESNPGARRMTRSATGAVPSARHLRPVLVDERAFAEFNRGTARARDAYSEDQYDAEATRRERDRLKKARSRQRLREESA